MSNPAGSLTTLFDEPAAPVRVDLGSWAALVETTKPGITRLVTMTSMVGFAMAATQRSWTPTSLYLHALICVIGTALSAAGANSINQWMERARDARMDRTKGRPIPSGRTAPRVVLWAGVVLACVGVGVLTMVGVTPALVSLACVLSYVFLYTPLKTRSTLATFVGAVPGGLPPLIGWTAATPTEGYRAMLEPLGLSLLGLMLVWQIPHFLAIAWMYREDYRRGGYRVLPLIEGGERWTAWVVLLWSLALVPALVLPALIAPDLLGGVYVTIALLTGAGYVTLCARLVMRKDRASARAVFFGSIAHLPVVLAAMVGEALIRTLA